MQAKASETAAAAARSSCWRGGQTEKGTPRSSPLKSLKRASHDPSLGMAAAQLGQELCKVKLRRSRTM